MKKAIKAGILIVTLAVAAPGFNYACQFDTDCEPGSKCLKASGSIYGVCVGGISPGNRNDRQPVYSPQIQIGRMATHANSIPTVAQVQSV